MLQILNQKTKGFFIECGAADGIRFSNSLFFERARSWTGLLVEPNTDLFKSLTKLNRNAYSINSCLSTFSYEFNPDETQQLDFFTNSPKYKNANTATFVFVVSFKINKSDEVCKLEM